MAYISIQDFLLGNGFTYTDEAFRRNEECIHAEDLIGKPLSYFEERYTVIPVLHNPEKMEQHIEEPRWQVADVQSWIERMGLVCDRTPVRRSTMSLDEKVDFVRCYGQWAYLDLPE